MILAALAALLLLPAAATAESRTVELAPGVAYTREVRFANGGPLVVHSIVAPRPGGLYALKPVLSNGSVLGRERLSDMQRRLSRDATVGGVNGDLFTLETGHPSGIFIESGIVQSRPIGGRSSLAIGLDGLLRVARVDFFGTWQIGDGVRAPLAQFNRPLDEKDGVVLFTPPWGGPTPRVKGAVDVVVSGFPATIPNADLTGTVAEVRKGGGTPVPAGGAVLHAEGFWAEKLRAQAEVGAPLSARLILRPWFTDVLDAIGGGPLLVRDGRPVYRSNEAFLPSQLRPRHPRTAVGQLADGRILLVAIDGRSGWSQGVRAWELALELVRLGAVTAMGLDAGGSTTMAWDGRVLNAPSDGAERSLSDALMVFYYGAYAPEARYPLLSPNGDGVAERQLLGYKVARPSAVDARLVAPDGSVAWSFTGNRRPGLYPVRPNRLTALGQEGRYRWLVRAIDTDGVPSEIARTFVVNNTLGFLRAAPERLRLRPSRGGELTASFELASSARLLVRVLDGAGRAVRTLLAGRETGPRGVDLAWNGKDGRNRVVSSGRYTVEVEARNALGRVTLERDVLVQKLKPPKKKTRNR